MKKENNIKVIDSLAVAKIIHSEKKTPINEINLDIDFSERKILFENSNT